jgi:Uma2 family endonuclease
MTTVKPQEWTYEDYLALPEGGALRYEVIDGDLYMTPAPNLRHQRISINLSKRLRHFLRSNPIGEVFAAPCDVIFAHAPLQYVEPDLIVEILYPATEKRDRREKFSLYERFGVPEYWIVDPETVTVQVFRLADGRCPAPMELRKTDVLESPCLPGLAIPLSDVFSG